MKKLVLLAAIGLTACGTGKKSSTSNPTPEVKEENKDAPAKVEKKEVEQKTEKKEEQKPATTPTAPQTTQPVAPKFLVAKVAVGSEQTTDEKQVSYSFAATNSRVADSNTSLEDDIQPTVRGSEFKIDADDSTFWTVYRPWSFVNRVGRSICGPSPRFFAYLNSAYGCGYTYVSGYSFDGYSYSYYAQSGCGPFVPNAPIPVYPAPVVPVPAPFPAPVGVPAPLPAPVGVPAPLPNPVGVPPAPLPTPGGVPATAPAPLPTPVGVPATAPAPLPTPGAGCTVGVSTPGC